jgi:hypothetical protein
MTNSPALPRPRLVILIGPAAFRQAGAVPPGTAYSEERPPWIRSKPAEKLRYKAGWDYAKRMIELGRKGDIHSIRAAELAQRKDAPNGRHPRPNRGDYSRPSRCRRFSIRRHERCTISSSRQVVCHGRGTEYPFHNRCSGLQYRRSCPLGISRRYGSTISPELRKREDKPATAGQDPREPAVCRHRLRHPDDEHDGHGAAIRLARHDGPAAARLARTAAHRAQETLSGVSFRSRSPASVPPPPRERSRRSGFP